ncbi:hypothetical protein NEOLEDRAFT_1110792 [Neolentinus lepideus HHB14362 ss-1]|uniref:Uncharacterized protein n=1 Tax=Neolentinus lepideus HHB14362 ss-1 TaxID=1314782 RepID=A0A165TYY6_9AGAM|nr:hypothetical protein NEOLEDRAFT_1110792 [Neolentinus lepideus HHB14362 ss-1]
MPPSGIRSITSAPNLDPTRSAMINSKQINALSTSVGRSNETQPTHSAQHKKRPADPSANLSGSQSKKARKSTKMHGAAKEAKALVLHSTPQDSMRPPSVPSLKSSTELATASGSGTWPSPSKISRLQNRSLVSPTPLSEHAISNIKTPPGRKFKPLVSCKATLPCSAVSTPQPSLEPPESSTSIDSVHVNCAQDLLLASRSHPIPECPRITMPPSLSQRKRVQWWAVILSGVSDAERRQCAQVSRMIRYAIYLSAAVVLHREFPGKRLDAVLQKYPNSLAMTNFWPYLRQRRRERVFWDNVYRRTFLASFLEDGQSISELMWTSPDDEKQVTVALRFVMTRLWFAISLGKLQSNWVRGVVTSAQVVVGDIWVVKVRYGANEVAFYVLEPTCEVIGRLHPNIDGPDASAIPIRADWSAYIDRLRATGQSTSASILSQLRWANYEEYERGISRLWLKRIESEGEVGRAKRIVAERYVLACVVANSVSGQWMSTTQMAQEFAGLSAGTVVSAPRNAQTPVNLYLPAQVHHHVESVHFTTSGPFKHPLHCAVAVIQTPAREYYILRDNGMQIGCEEEGMSEVWMELLGCGPSGVVSQHKIQK